MLQEWFDYLKARIGKSIYVWGAQGKKFKSYDEAHEYIDRYETTSRNKKRAYALLNKLKAKGVPIEEVQAFDCSGLVMYYLQKIAHVFSSDMTANGLKGKCEKISKAESKPGDLVFRVNAVGHAYHVGCVTPDGIVECKGRDDGVVINKSNYWNRYGRPKFWKDEIEKVEDKDMLIKIGDKGLPVVLWQNALINSGHKGKMDPTLININTPYGPNTAAATKEFQKANGLPETGEVDNLTAAMMWGKARETEITVLKKANDELTSKGDATCKLWGR